jgi:drug/metabolite transporter (DMT)-like permease
MWSSGFVGARLGTDAGSADTLLAWRFLLAAAVLVSWMAIRRTWAPRGSGVPHAVIGLLTQCGYLGGIVTGVGMGVPAGTAALIAALQPPLVGALAGRVLGEPVSARQWWGVWLGLTGVAVVVAGDIGRGSAPAVAYLLPVGGMAALSAGTLLERRWRSAGTIVESLAVHCLVGVVFFGGLAALNERFVPPADGGFWLAVAWIVVLSHFGGYGFYLAVLRRGGATKVSTLLYLTPPATMLWAFVMFGDPVTAAGAAGLGMCAAAVWLVLHRPRVHPHLPDGPHGDLSPARNRSEDAHPSAPSVCCSLWPVTRR